MAHSKVHAKKHSKKRPLTGAAKASLDFAGGKEHGGWSVRTSKEGFGYVVHVRKGQARRIAGRGSKAHCDDIFVREVVAMKS